MRYRVEATSPDNLLALRTRYRAEMNCQIIHDSIHRRSGWALCYLFHVDGDPAGFGSVAVAGPWKDKPTIYEFYLRDVYRCEAFHVFDAFLAESRAAALETQTNDLLLPVMMYAYGREVNSEAILFADQDTSRLNVPGAVLRRVTELEEIHQAIEQRQGGGEWVLEIGGVTAARGGILFHYNWPYGDVYMEVTESARRQGVGSYLVQELKRECYQLGAVPAARCNRDNIASRLTLQKAGFAPVAHIINASLPRSGAH